MYRPLLVSILLVLLSLPFQAGATADGPDHYRVSADAPVALRAAPYGEAETLGTVPPGTDGLRNLGCQGGLSFAEWAEATPEERETAKLTRWCRVAWQDLEGWIIGTALAEGTAPVIPVAGPGDGGPRYWQVSGVKTVLNLRAAASTSVSVITRYRPGTILVNLGCEATGGRSWCDVQRLGGGPRGFVAADFLAPAAGPDGAVPVGWDTSASRAGQGAFDATGSVPCAQASGQPLAPCPFGVARSPGGDASLAVTRPDGTVRMLYFALGRFRGADTSQADGYPEHEATREADVTRVRVGTERYEIPDAAILGG